uniref:Uncharacterized protein n=1 Tax=Pararge aegeria TaxID=116150 RepID=S4P869_9NEOP
MCTTEWHSELLSNVPIDLTGHYFYLATLSGFKNKIAKIYNNIFITQPCTNILSVYLFPLLCDIDKTFLKINNCFLL